ncbi:MAG: thiamine pyrophosphate-binding protein, partial [Steroidobacteraceae bacterium]
MQRDRPRDGHAGPQASGRPGDAGRDLTARTAAEAFLAALARRGVEYLYVNAGTDFASVVEAYARRNESGLELPTPVICPHENLAVGMAHGYALATGRPQAVMVHVSVGTANCVCGILNAARDQVPLLLAAGRTPLYEKGRPGARNASIHWAQEMFDQAGLVRELVKWDYELRDALQADLVADRALAVARTAPQGPVYVTLPREVLAQEPPAGGVFEAATAIPAEPAADPAGVERLAELLTAAELPVIITSAAGGSRETVAAFGRLVERFGIGVVEYRARRLSLPASHPLHLGGDNRIGLEQADLIVVLESDVPWMPEGNGEPRPEARIVQIGVDPLFARYPIRSFRSDLTLATSLTA